MTKVVDKLRVFLSKFVLIEYFLISVITLNGAPVLKMDEDYMRQG